MDIRMPKDLDWPAWVTRWERMQERSLVGRDERFKVVARLVGDTQGPAPLILDLGCGTGSLMVVLLEAMPGAQVVGVDLDPSLLLLAEKRLATFGERAQTGPGRFSQNILAGGYSKALLMQLYPRLPCTGSVLSSLPACMAKLLRCSGRAVSSSMPITLAAKTPPSSRPGASTGTKPWRSKLTLMRMIGMNSSMLIWLHWAPKPGLPGSKRWVNGREWKVECHWHGTSST